MGNLVADSPIRNQKRMSNTTQHEWQVYVKQTTEVAAEALAPLNITLEEHQPHTLGERFLMEPVTTTGGKKLILVGSKGAERFVIKIAAEGDGRQEIEDERKARSLIQNIDFNYQPFNAPKEIANIEHGSFLVNVQEYIDQTSTFIDRPMEEQFSFALNSFKDQERTRATTHRHFKRIAGTLGTRTWITYQELLASFISTLNASNVVHDFNPITEATKRLVLEHDRIEQYCGFLTHTDFVPHNFRIKNDKMYLLDFSSFCFGNKHESWARFLNFMTLYNRELESLLIKYVDDNRSVEERESLQLMRLYRLCEIITYYVKKIPLSDGKLQELNTARVELWLNVLKAELENSRVSEDIITTYQKKRDGLRSEDEKVRQVGLH